jgi:S-phase kinase-associated protein 1
MGVTIITSDFQHIDADNSLLEQSIVINDIIEDIGDDEPIPLPTITSKVLTKILEYCSFYSVSHLECEVEEFNKGFVNIDIDFIFDLIQGANFLNIKSLLDILCAAVADRIRGKTPEQIREVFGIANDLTPEEEAAALAEHSWTHLVPIEDY